MVVVLLVLGCPSAFGQIPPVTGGASNVTVQFSSNPYTVNESDGTAVLTVELNTAAADVVTVNYATSNGTAVAGTDYLATGGTVFFSPGVTSQTISVSIINNGNYSDQTVYFTVALSNPSPNASLVAPPSTTVNILDNDVAPSVDIEINGVNSEDKQKVGGFVPVNANNDNGSVINYANGVAITVDRTTKLPIFAGIPTMRDFDPKNVNLAAEDPDLVQINLMPKNLKIGGPETIVFSVAFSGRAQGIIWDTAKKNNKVITPTNWTVANMLQTVFFEGTLEGDALREITLTVQVLNNGKLVSTDNCTLTVTPVLTSFTVVAAQGAVPNIDVDNQGNWGLDSGAGQPNMTFTVSASAQWNALSRGKLRFIQCVHNANNLVIQGQPGTWGADLGPRTWDFDKPNVGAWLVDCWQAGDLPFNALKESNPNGNLTPDGIASNSVFDSPKLYLNVVNNLLPSVGAMTNIDVTYQYVTYATVAYSDMSIYCLGQQTWNVHYQGAVLQPGAPLAPGNFWYGAGAANADNGSLPFGPAVRNNNDPVDIGPTYANAAAPGWR